ncbi:SH3 domain-containing protein [Listeria fleischmannii]|uniref:SH3 domain-containing protein n=1 Tax=Listeria fleischmannii TaxID=1069827 RepID=UPI0016271037|nr:hypothetical protein [Listeria fleischmannii]MBC1418480.1 hypothetical protein [Listeria fleischmannii]
MKNINRIIIVISIFCLVGLGLPEYKAKAATINQYYALEGINPRAENNWDSAVMMKVPRGYAVQVNMDNYKGTWYEVTFKGSTGWIPLKYLSSTRYFTDYVTNSEINIRKESLWDSEVVIKIPKHTTVWVVNNGTSLWPEIIYQGKTGYIPSSYIIEKNSEVIYKKLLDQYINNKKILTGIKLDEEISSFEQNGLTTFLTEDEKELFKEEFYEISTDNALKEYDEINIVEFDEESFPNLKEDLNLTEEDVTELDKQNLNEIADEIFEQNDIEKPSFSEEKQLLKGIKGTAAKIAAKAALKKIKNIGRTTWNKNVNKVVNKLIASSKLKKTLKYVLGYEFMVKSFNVVANASGKIEDALSTQFKKAGMSNYWAGTCSRLITTIFL